MARKPQYKPQQVADALRKSRGIKAAAARLLGCERETVENYCKRYPQVQAVCDEARQTLVDLAEGQLVRQVDQGDQRAVFFVLTTLGKDRGYAPAQQHEHAVELTVVDAREKLLAEIQERRARIQALPAHVIDGERQERTG
jgi:hypothetical protein